MTGARERTLVKLLIGHESEPIDNPSGDHSSFRWTCFIRPVNGLPNFEDRSFISKVKFKLHESFAQPVRIVREPPFEVNETCYGSFEIYLEIDFAYPGAKSMKYTYDMLIQLEKKSQASTEVMFELKDAPSNFIEQARKYGVKRKRSGGTAEENLRDVTLPPLKIQKTEDFERLTRESKPKKEDRSSKEKPLKEKQPKDREKKRDKEKSHDKEKNEKYKKNEEREKKRDEKQPKGIVEDKSKVSPLQLKFTPPYRPSPIPKNSPDLNKFKKETPYNSPSVAIKINHPKAYLKHLPSKEEKKCMNSESDVSSPSTSYGSLTPKTPLSLPNPGIIMSPSEMQRRISLLTDEDQIFRVATLLISAPGTNIYSSKLSFDIDLSTVDPNLISKLNEALL